jgi:hypothetical protein
MGYHTDFTGRFDCYRVEGPVFGQFLKAVYSGDRTALRAFGDWLIDQGDPRGDKVCGLAARWNKATPAFWRLFGLRPEQAAYLKRFSETRRMRRDASKAGAMPDPVREAVDLPPGEEAAYFVGAVRQSEPQFPSWAGDESVLNGNIPPQGQPGLWCKWCPNEEGTAIVWNGVEKFYDYVKWLEYLIAHFLRPWGYVLNGEVKWRGEDRDDRGIIRVSDSEVRTKRLGDDGN